MAKVIVQKYGGSSVATVERIKKVAQNIVSYRRKGYRVMAVVSALGDTTDSLLIWLKKSQNVQKKGSWMC